MAGDHLPVLQHAPESFFKLQSIKLSTSTSIELGEILKPFSLQCQFDYAEKRHCGRGGETKLQREHQD